MSDKTLPIHKVVKNLEERLSEVPVGSPHFADPRYEPVELCKENFHPVEDIDTDRTVCFVDGGYAPIVSAPNFTVGLVRVDFCKFKGQRRKTPHSIPRRVMTYVICCAKAKRDTIFYETEFVPLKDEWEKYLPQASDLRFSSFDESLRFGRQRVPIERAAASARVFMEWSFATHLIADELERDDILVKDGSLQTMVTNEVTYAELAYSNAIRKGIVFTGLSKSSRLFTSTGHPLFSAIDELSRSTPLQNSSWFYHPIVKITHPDHRAEMYAVKLHNVSEYVFRFEILRDQFGKMSKEDTESIIGALAVNSHDICFPGYPYGLIEADRFSRVTHHERSMQEVQFKSASASDGIWNDLSKHLKCINAHSILDEIAGG